jgi:hypothetical protein
MLALIRAVLVLTNKSINGGAPREIPLEPDSLLFFAAVIVAAVAVIAVGCFYSSYLDIMIC